MATNMASSPHENGAKSAPNRASNRGARDPLANWQTWFVVNISQLQGHSL